MDILTAIANIFNRLATIADELTPAIIELIKEGYPERQQWQMQRRITRCKRHCRKLKPITAWHPSEFLSFKKYISEYVAQCFDDKPIERQTAIADIIFAELTK